MLIFPKNYTKFSLKRQSSLGLHITIVTPKIGWGLYKIIDLKNL
jgi:hypothetical protein